MIFRWFESLIKVFTEPSDNMPPTSVWRFYTHYLKQVWPIFLLVFVTGFAVAFIEVLLFAFIGTLIDWVGETAPQDIFQVHGLGLFGMAIVIVLARPFFSALRDLLVNQAIVPNLTNRIRWQHHRYVMGQSMTFFLNDFAGRITNRIMRTGAALRESTLLLVDTLWYVTVYTGSAIALFAKADLWLAVPLILWIVIYIISLALFIPVLKQRSWASSAARSKLMGRIVDGYTNIMTLKLFAHRQHEDQYIADALDEQTRKLAMMTRVSTALDVSITSLNGILIAGTAGLSLWLWSQGSVSAGAIAFSTGLAIRISNMSGWIMRVVNTVFESVGAVQDGMTTISKPRHVQDKPSATRLDIRQGNIDFKHIRFAYNANHVIIPDLDVHIRSGEKIGLVGPSGAGKSTLVRLLLRLYDLDAGQILIDGQNIHEVTQESLRGHIAMVTQDTSLLHRSVRDNILYGNPEASKEALEAAISKAHADSFIPDLVDQHGHRGLDALVGERGVKLSGGQRQRIAIARVLLKNAPILILDEATSALDSEVEAAIQESLDQLMQHKTVLAIAHRLSTIARMDRLIVMDKGQIVETGSHQELIQKNGLYARLWKRQSGDFMHADSAVPINDA